MDEATPDERTRRSGILAGQLVALGAAFRERLARDRESLTTLQRSLGASPTGETLRAIELSAHKLHGTAAMFGYATLGAAASQLERVARDALAGEMDEAAAVQALASAHAGLMLEIDAALAAPAPPPQTK